MAEMIPDGTLERKPIIMNSDTLPKSNKPFDLSEDLGEEGITTGGDSGFGELAPEVRKLDQLRQELLNADVDDSSLPKMKRDVQALRRKVENYRRRLSSFNLSFINWSKRRLNEPGRKQAEKVSRCLKRAEAGVREYSLLLRDLSTYLNVGHNKKAGDQAMRKILRRRQNVRQSWISISGCR